MKFVANPYGISVPKNETPIVVGKGERRHLLSPKGDRALCQQNRAAGEIRISRAGKVDCYRCIKLHMMNTAEGFATVERYMRPSERTKRLKHIMVEGGREGEFIGMRSPRNSARKAMGPRRTEFGPHEIPEFAWGGLPRQRGQGPTQTRFSDRSDMVQIAPGQAVELQDFIKRVTGRPGYQGAYERIANPAFGYTHGTSAGGVKYRPALGHSISMREFAGERPYGLEYMGNVLTFFTEARRKQAADTIRQAKGQGYEREALRAASALQYQRNPGQASRKPARPSAHSAGSHSRNVEAFIAGGRAGEAVYEAGATLKHRARSFGEPGRVMIAFPEFFRRAQAMGGKFAKVAAFKKGVEDAYHEAKRFVEDPYGEIAPPRFYYNPKHNRRNNPSDWALAYEGRLRDLTGESDGLIHVGPQRRRNGTRSFTTRDGRVVTFKTKRRA